MQLKLFPFATGAERIPWRRFIGRVSAGALVPAVLIAGLVYTGDAADAKSRVIQLGLYQKPGLAWWAWKTVEQREPELAKRLEPMVAPLNAKRPDADVALRAVVPADADVVSLCRRMVGAGLGCLEVDSVPVPTGALSLKTEAVPPAPPAAKPTAKPAAPPPSATAMATAPAPLGAPVTAAATVAAALAKPTALPTAAPSVSAKPAAASNASADLATAQTSAPAVTAPPLAPATAAAVQTSAPVSPPPSGPAAVVAVPAPFPGLAPAPMTGAATPPATVALAAGLPPLGSAVVPIGPAMNPNPVPADGSIIYQAEDARTMAEIDRRNRRQGRLGAVLPGMHLDVTQAALIRNGLNYCAITLDDGPHRIVTRKILEILDTEKVVVTYFPIGKPSEVNGDIIHDFVAAGHEVGNHSLTHADLRSASPEVQKNEVAETNRILRSFGANPILFRPPFGRYNDSLIRIAQAEGMSTVLWNVDTRDWQSRDPDKIVHQVQTSAGTGAVILLHSTYPTTASALPRVIADLRKKGCTFVTLSQWIAKMKQLADPPIVASTSTSVVN